MARLVDGLVARGITRRRGGIARRAAPHVQAGHLCEPHTSSGFVRWSRRFSSWREVSIIEALIQAQRGHQRILRVYAHRREPRRRARRARRAPRLGWCAAHEEGRGRDRRSRQKATCDQRDCSTALLKRQAAAKTTSAHSSRHTKERVADSGTASRTTREPTNSSTSMT